jgi:hypothetical protein
LGDEYGDGVKRIGHARSLRLRSISVGEHPGAAVNARPAAEYNVDEALCLG